MEAARPPEAWNWHAGISTASVDKSKPQHLPRFKDGRMNSTCLWEELYRNTAQDIVVWRSEKLWPSLQSTLLGVKAEFHIRKYL